MEESVTNIGYKAYNLQKLQPLFQGRNYYSEYNTSMKTANQRKIQQRE